MRGLRKVARPGTRGRKAGGGRRAAGGRTVVRKKGGARGPGAADLRRTRSALRRAETAVSRAAAALREVVHVADSLRERGAEEFRAEAAESLVKEGVLLGFARLAGGSSAGDGCASCRGMASAGEGFLQWAERELGVRPHLEAGRRLTVPAAGLKGFSVSGEVPEGAALVPLEVLAPGWRRGDMVLAAPLVRVVERTD